MKTTTVSTRMYSLIVLYDMHTDFFKKAIEGVSHEDANNRLSTKANHMAWLTGSLVQERFEMAGLLGNKMQQAADDLFQNHQGIKDGVTYPPLESFGKDWDTISPICRELLANITDEQLDSMFEMPDMPDMKMTYFDLIAFTCYREANCIGQLILWRRLLGYEGIRYDG